MKKKLFPTIIAFLLIVGTIQAQQVIKVGIFDLKPHMEYNDATKTAKGAAVEYLNAMAKQMGYTLEWSIYPLPRLVAMIYAGELDCTIFLSKNPEREEKLIYSETPLLLIKPILVVKKESLLKEIKTAAEIKGLKIGFLKGANPTSKFMKENESQFTWELQSPESASKMLYSMLLADRIDAIYDNNDITYVYEAKQQGIKDKVRFLYTPDSVGSVFVAASKLSKNGLAFVAAYNAYLKKTPTPYAPFLKPYIE